MKQTHRRRPELESLESLMLLSAAAAKPHGAHPALLAPVPVALSGDVHASGDLSAARVVVSGTGSLNSVGTVSLRYATLAKDPSHSATLVGKHGKLILVADMTAPLAAGTSTIPYRIVGGTGSYRGAIGQGNATVTLTTPPSGKSTLDVTFA